MTFEESLVLADAIQKLAPGERRVRRLTLFDSLDRSPESGPSRSLVSTSSRYGLTTGGYTAEYIQLTDDGNRATNPEVTATERFKARFHLAIETHSPFAFLYEKLKNNRLPAQRVLHDMVAEQGEVQSTEVKECVDVFILNAKFLGLLKTLSGAERLLSLEHAVEEITKKEYLSRSHNANGAFVADSDGIALSDMPFIEATPSDVDWSKTCFYVTPIGEDGSDPRKHSDLFLNSIVQPAMEELGLTVVRADNIGKPGMITQQIIEHVVRAKLVVADLSFHNPNVFYELCLRHALMLPTVQLTRKLDPVPFDLNQFRTVRIDTTDIYSLVPQLETYKSELATHARQALNDPEGVASNPLSVFCPGLKTTVPTYG